MCADYDYDDNESQEIKEKKAKWWLTESYACWGSSVRPFCCDVFSEGGRRLCKGGVKDNIGS